MKLFRQLLIVLIIGVLGLAACGSRNPAAPASQPAWLSDLIVQLESQPVANPPAYISRSVYRNQTVYYLPARCCDISSNLYDVDGKILCHPDGGFAGQGDGRCSSFLSEKSDEQVVWRDPRGKG
jgi:hypothetical protein